MAVAGSAVVAGNWGGKVWSSTAFNMVVLVLIISNFAFTVQELQNTDPMYEQLTRFLETIRQMEKRIITAGDNRCTSQNEGLRRRDGKNDEPIVKKEGLLQNAHPPSCSEIVI